MTEDKPTVLVVDDEPQVGEAFALWLGDRCHVVLTTSGSEALEEIHDGVEVVLLDRHMPGMSGDEVLERIRADGYDCRVAMVTAVSVGLDVVDLPVDDYVPKPVDHEVIQSVVDRLLVLRGYGEEVTALYSVEQKLASLEARRDSDQLTDSDQYEDLLAERERLRDSLDESLDDDVEELIEDAAERGN